MQERVAFLHALAQALSVLSLYPAGHASRERAVDSAHTGLQRMLEDSPRVTFGFLGSEVLADGQPVRELRDWEWAERLPSVGIQQLEFDGTVTQDELEEFLDLVLARLGGKPVDTTEARQMRPCGIRYGAIGIHDVHLDGHVRVAATTLSMGMVEEASAVRWLHQEITRGKELPLAEAEAVVRSLAIAMHGDHNVMLPLLQLREFDEYTTTHSLNVSVLAMALSEWIGLGSQDVRAFGVAGLLHDLGKVRIPIEVLTKPGKLEPEERELMNQHPAEGARIIFSSEPGLDLAAVVAYEHHVMLNGGGYPTFSYPRDCHFASRLVHVCDVYDALRTKRPYRDAWPHGRVLSYLSERAGSEFDGEMTNAFTAMIAEWEPADVQQWREDGDEA
ncbi:MAG: HD domain-containing protein [Gemmatimonadota bacterium]|nr:HD domain-containing protein [Gemmatimonadota bacterium]MDH3368855.1 HD domain-containing protein [Gemmatimonadota bacterium]MDH3477032.1 HD domain-containing protein [Gemmatimonadota bacterium]MDH3569959.1 HD domain-containing protein [Gemmatimonadota bacterium]